MALEDRLIDWDGKSADFLRDVYDSSVDDESFLSDLFHLIAEPNFRTAATWLLKRHLDEGHSITGRQKSALIQSMKTLDDWESKLHVLQCLPKLSTTRTQADQTIAFLRHCLEDKNKFVRAWAYGGFLLLSQQHEEFQAEASERIAWANQNEAPSIRARIRQVLKNTTS